MEEDEHQVEEDEHQVEDEHHVDEDEHQEEEEELQVEEDEDGAEWVQVLELLVLVEHNVMNTYTLTKF